MQEIGAHNVDKRKHDLRDRLGGEPHGVGDIDGVHPGTVPLSDQAIEDAEVRLLAVEGLRDLYALNGLLHIRVQVGVFIGDHLIGAALLRLDD